MAHLINQLTYQRLTLKVNGITYPLSNCLIDKSNLKKHYSLVSVNGIEYAINNNNGFAYKLY
jgi:hypothetical protein